jgi:hypothetical protein
VVATIIGTVVTLRGGSDDGSPNTVPSTVAAGGLERKTAGEAIAEFYGRTLTGGLIYVGPCDEATTEAEQPQGVCTSREAVLLPGERFQDGGEIHSTGDVGGEAWECIFVAHIPGPDTWEVRARAFTCDSLGTGRVDADEVLYEHFRGSELGFTGPCDQGYGHPVEERQRPVCAGFSGRRPESRGGGELWSLYDPGSWPESTAVLRCVAIGASQDQPTPRVLEEGPTCEALPA